MIKIFIIFYSLILSSSFCFAAESSVEKKDDTKRKPSAEASVRVVVINPKNTQFERTEIWYDDANRVICYVVGKNHLYSSPSISCVESK